MLHPRSVRPWAGICGLGDLKIALRGGGGGDTDPRRRREGGGLEKWGSVSGPLFCVRTDVGAKGAGTQNFGPKKFFPPIISPPPHLSSQNDQRDVGIILSHGCWVDPPPRHGRSDTPALNPPLPSRRPRRGGVGKMGLRVTPPPPQSNFLPALLHHRKHTGRGVKCRLGTDTRPCAS